jgi:hypothetical protein
MREVYCRDCRRFEFHQADEVPQRPYLRPSLAEVLGWALILGAYFMAVAWAVSR